MCFIIAWPSSSNWVLTLIAIFIFLVAQKLIYTWFLCAFLCECLSKASYSDQEILIIAWLLVICRTTQILVLCLLRFCFSCQFAARVKRFIFPDALWVLQSGILKKYLTKLAFKFSLMGYSTGILYFCDRITQLIEYTMHNSRISSTYVICIVYNHRNMQLSSLARVCMID